MTTAPFTSDDPSQILSQLDAYPWATDAEFQAGLRAILSSATSPAQIRILTLRARCFYWNRKFPESAVEWGVYERHVASQPPAQPLQSQSQSQSQSQCLPLPQDTIQPPISTPPEPTPQNILNPPQNDSTPTIPTTNPLPQDKETAAAGEPQYPRSFASLVELIQSGAPIPGIREIPDTVLVGRESKAEKGRRRKPWEKEGGDERDGNGNGEGEKGRAEGTFGDRRDEVIVQEFPEGV